MKKKKKFVGGFDDLKKDKNGDEDTNGGFLGSRGDSCFFFFFNFMFKLIF